MKPNTVKWTDIIRVSTVNIIVGKKGMGKSALAYFLLEKVAAEYHLKPVVVGIPREKRHLLPDITIAESIDDAVMMENACILIDEGTLMLPAGKDLERLVMSVLSLSRQRHQIVFFVFHSSRDVGSRILRGIDTVLVKTPSKRQIDQGSKDNWWYSILTEARSKLRTKKDAKRYVYVDCEEPEFRGLMENGLPSFWSEELSEVWAGIKLSQETRSNFAAPDEPLEVFTCKSCGKYAYMVGGTCEYCGYTTPAV